MKHIYREEPDYQESHRLACVNCRRRLWLHPDLWRLACEAQSFDVEDISPIYRDIDNEICKGD